VTTALDRGLALLEHLSGQPEGLSLSTLSDELDIPRSACHRLLAELQRCGYVRQVRSHGDYMLTTKLVSLGLGFLSSSGIVDIAEPLLERVAKESGELVRLAIVDDDRLTWVAKAQGTRKDCVTTRHGHGRAAVMHRLRSRVAADAQRRTRPGTRLTPGLRSPRTTDRKPDHHQSIARHPARGRTEDSR